MLYPTTNTTYLRDATLDPTTTSKPCTASELDAAAMTSGLPG
jgi:hypothetical protein